MEIANNLLALSDTAFRKFVLNMSFFSLQIDFPKVRIELSSVT